MKLATFVFIGACAFAQVPETVATISLDAGQLVIHNAGTKPITAVALRNLDTQPVPRQPVRGELTPGLLQWSVPLQPGETRGITETSTNPSRIRIEGVLFDDGAFLGTFTAERVEWLYLMRAGEAEEWEHWQRVARDIDGEAPGKAAKDWAAKVKGAASGTVMRDVDKAGEIEAHLRDWGRDQALGRVKQQAERVGSLNETDAEKMWPELKNWVATEASKVRANATRKAVAK